MKKLLLLSILGWTAMTLGTGCVVNKEEPASEAVRSSTTTSESHTIRAY